MVRIFLESIKQIVNINLNFFRLFFCGILGIYFFVMLPSEQVLIITYSYNRPDFIEWQYKTLEKFLLDDL
jgi:hypothetical protein